jgi:hypothetical protein
MDILRHLFLEDPLPLWIMLGLGAIAAAIIWARTGSRRALAAAGAMIGAGVVLGLVAWLVETDEEKVARSVATMADAAAAGNAEIFIERISPAYRSGTFGKDELAGIVRNGLMVVRAQTEAPAVTVAGGEATVIQIYRLVPLPGSGLAIPPDWQRVTWEGRFAPDSDGEWRLRSAVSLSPKRMAPEEAGKYLRRVPR